MTFMSLKGPFGSQLLFSNLEHSHVSRDITLLWYREKKEKKSPLLAQSYCVSCYHYAELMTMKTTSQIKIHLNSFIYVYDRTHSASVVTIAMGYDLYTVYGYDARRGS